MTGAERFRILKSVGIKGDGTTPWDRLTADEKLRLDAKYGDKGVKSFERANGPAERAAADRLEKLWEQRPVISRNSPEGSAYSIIRGMIDDLRKPKTLDNVVDMLGQASDRLMRKYPAQAQVVDEVIGELSKDSSDAPAQEAGKSQIQPNVQKLSAKTPNTDRLQDALKKGDGKSVSTETSPTPEKAAPAVSQNTIFTDDAAAKARELLRKKLGGQLNSGIDPEVMQAGITLAGWHIEKGARTFATYAKAMLTDLGEIARPYLKSWYLGVKFDPRAADFEGMDSAATVEAADVAALGGNNAGTVPTEAVPAGRAGEAETDVPAGHRNSEPLGAGLAGSGEGTDRVRGVSSGPEGAGTQGARGAERSGQPASRPPRNRADDGAEPQSADEFVDDAEEIGKGGLTKKFRDNVSAIRILKAMEAEGREPTPDERKQIAKYVGWGALKGVFDPENKQWSKQHEELKGLLTDAEWRAARASTLNAHYTSPVAVGAMYDAMARLGFTGGRLLEPSVGIGNFFGLMPKAMRSASQLYGVELDSLTSRLVAAMYPKAKIAKETGFEDYEVPGEFFDAVIGNPPFGNLPVVDKERSAYSGHTIHNYFLAKSIDKLRPGGIMQVVVSHNFLDAMHSRTRDWIAERANLIGAVRLPNTAFKENAGTEVVTDILIFQKKGEGEGRDVGAWLETVDQNNTGKNGEPVTHSVNQFFVAHPEFVLGTPSAAGTMYRPNQYTVAATGDLKSQLAEWVKTLPQNLYTPIVRKKEGRAEVEMAVPDGIKVGSYYVDGSGTVQQRTPDEMGAKKAAPWTAPNQTAVERMKGMIAIRDALRQQMRLERSVDASESEIEYSRARLNGLYDSFVKEYGHLNHQTNRRLFLDDTEAPLLQALEFDYDKGISKNVAEKEGVEPKEPSAKKADIFERRVAFPPQDRMTVTTAKDALLAALNYRGRVDLDYMAEVYGKKSDAIVEELGDLVFDDPQDGVVTADEYLSGDVKTKLAEAQAAARDDARYQRNVAALEKVIPVDKKPSEISVSIGASFVPPEVYGEFVQHISGGSAVATYLKATGQWLVEFDGRTDPALNTGKFGTSHLSARDLFSLSMLGRGAVVRKTERNADGSTTTVVLEKETEAAREKQNAIKSEWQAWLWRDPERADRIAAIYNEKMNRIVERKFDGSHLTFPGMNPGIALLAHQKNGVWRGLQTFQVLYDQVVGAGKTFEMATLAMEMRRLGVARKPLFVVPNHLTLVWRSEFTRLYPGSNVLAATPDDFSKEGRQKLFSKIVTGDWDAVVIGHSSLKKIGLPEETEKAVLQEQIDEIADAIEEMKRGRGDKRIVSTMEQIRKNLEAKMKDKLQAVGERDKVVTFDELGLDAMFVDEMHEFKNLTYNSTMDRNPGMGNPAGSAKAFDMFVKVRWLFDTFGDKAPFITATGTPVSNSLVEMFNMQRYMQYPTLKREGLHVFDAWAKQFGSVENVYEVAPSGSGYRQSTRFAKFTNLPALMSLYKSFADIITLDDLKAQEAAQGKVFPVPKVQGGRPTIVVAKRSPLQSDFMGVPRAETDAAGNIQFEAQFDEPPEIVKNEQTGKWHVRYNATSDSGMNYTADGGAFDTLEDARLKVVEKALTPKVTVDPESILGRFGRLRELTRSTKGKVNALSLTGEANKAGLDYRLIDPKAPDFAGSKINLAVDNMVRIHKEWAADRGAQLVFCDLSVPLSARSSYASKPRRLYVRDAQGTLTMKRGTMHTMEGLESLPYFVVEQGQKEARRFEVYDAASGIQMLTAKTKAEARADANARIEDADQRQAWLDRRQAVAEVSQDEIDEYNDLNEVETEGFEFFSQDDIAGISGATDFSVYDDIKAKLIARGIPEKEIAFIHDYDTPSAKEKLFKAVNRGDVRFLFGSTPKMGAGTNVQERLVGLHHIDAPWRPSDLEQREGRIIRQKNALYARDPSGFEVFIGRYATEQTYDTRRWQILEHKARGIEQLRKYDGTFNEMDDIAGEASNSADMKAAASGDPLILEETKLRNEVRRLEQMQAAHADEAVSLTRKANALDRYADEVGPKELKDTKAMLATVAKHPLDKDGAAPITVDGRSYGDKDAIAAKLNGLFGSLKKQLITSATVQYRGLSFEMERGTVGEVVLRTPTGLSGVWGAADNFSPTGFITRLKNYIDRMEPASEDITARIAQSRTDAAGLREQAKAPFSGVSDLEAARTAHKRVQRALMAKGPVVPDDQKPALARAIEAQKAKLEELGYGDAVKEMLGNQEQPAYSRGAAAGKGLTTDQTKSVVQRVTHALHLLNVPKLNVVASVADLPADLRAMVERDGAEYDAEAIYWHGTVYMVAGNLRSPGRAAVAYLHEVVGHHGLRGTFGASLTDLLEQVATEREGEVRAVADRRGLDWNDANGRLMAAEEWLAEMAQTMPDLSLVQRAKAAIRSFLRKLGVVLKVTDAEIIRDIILPARQFVQAQARSTNQLEAAPALSRDPSGALEFARLAWTNLAQADDVFQEPKSPEKDMRAIAADLSPDLTVQKMDDREPGLAHRWKVKGVDGRAAFISAYLNGTVVLNIAASEPGSGGSTIYDLASTYAHNNGKVFIGDPEGLSEDAKYRRTENMLSSALKFGTTRHLRPHTKQGIEWDDGADEINLRRLIDAHYRNIVKAFPGIANYEFNLEKGAFVDRIDGHEVSDDEFRALSESPVSREARAGRSTLKRAALTGTFLREQSPEGRRRLLAYLSQQSYQHARLTPSLRGVLYSRPTMSEAATAGRDVLTDLLNRPGTFGPLARTLQTQYHKATKSPAFKAVWTRAHEMFMESARAMSRPASLAPSLLPKFDAGNLKAAAKALLTGKGRADVADIKAVSELLNEGTLYGGPSPITGKVWPEAQLREGVQIGRRTIRLTDTQIRMYLEARAAIDSSLTETAAAEAWGLIRRMTNNDAGLRAWISQNPDDAARVIPDALANLIQTEEEKIEDAKLALHVTDSEDRKKDLTNQIAGLEAKISEIKDVEERINAIFEKAATLKRAGYMPLMRFGRYKVTVLSSNAATLGDDPVAYVGRYESAFEANQARRELAKQYRPEDGYQISDVDVMDEEEWKLFKGVNPETVMLFAEEAGIEQSEVMQSWYKEATSNRSAFRRMIQRHGYAGYSEDLPRVLASFLTSNGKRAGYAYHLADMTELVRGIEQGDVKAEARQLLETIQETKESGSNIRGLMATWYLLGSAASAIVNLTQTATMSLPWLSQYGRQGFAPGQASKHLMRAYKAVFAKTLDGDLADAVQRAEEDGIVDSNEVYHLYAESMKPMIAKLGSGGVAYRARAFMTLWGAPFALAEKLNRKATFIAAYQMARENGKDNAEAFAFAEKSVIETQGIYASYNRPNWARGPVGGAVMTFKQYSIAYIEMLARMAKTGPEGKAAALLALAVLFLFAGLSGLPGEDDLLDVIDTNAQAFFGKATISKMEIRNALRDHLGKTLGEFVDEGVSAFLPLDISGRMSMGNLIPATGVLKPSNPNRQKEIMEGMGVAGGFVQSITQGASLLMEGSFTGAARTAAPKAIGDVIKGVEMATTGEARDGQGKKIVAADSMDAFMQAIGFNPAVKAEAQQNAWSVTELIGYHKKVESEIAAQWARGVMDKAPEQVAAAKQRLKDWNESNPDLKIRIGGAQILRRVRQLRMERDGRIAKTAPPEIRRTVKEMMQ